MKLHSLGVFFVSLLSIVAIATNDFEEKVIIEKRAVGVWPNRVLAPYLYLMKWPAFDVNSCIWNTGHKYYTLAFITGDNAGNPAWGGYDSIWDSWYSDYINNIRNQGGDVIISFGGAAGHELALVSKDAADLAAKYQQVIDRYRLTYIDVDIEGGAIYNPDSIERRSQALKLVRQKNPNIIISYTLPVTPYGLDDSGLYCIKSAVWNGLYLDVINLMTMDYGSVSDGGTGMGKYAISAAEGTYKQIRDQGMTNTKIGITPMIGRNDVWSEVFRLEDAWQVNEWAKTKDWVRVLTFWSINRDTDQWNDLYLSSQITQNKYDFVKIFKNWYESGSPIQQVPPPVVNPPVNGVPSTIFAPYVDILAWPTLDVNNIMAATGTKWFSLGFIIADKDNAASWGGYYKMGDKFYLDQINRLRAAGGDVIISFGGAAGTELAMISPDVATLQNKYQQVIDLYKPKWVDFDIEGVALSNRAKIDLRTQALVGLRKANPGMKIAYTLPVTPNGLSDEGLYILQSSKAFGFNFDVLNLMTMVYGLPEAGLLAKYAMSSASGAFNQLISVGIEGCKIGITPMIGVNDDNTVFSLSNAKEVTDYARQQRNWISLVSFWSANRDNGAKKGLWASSQITQNDWDFTNIMKNWNSDVVVNPPVAIPTTTNAVVKPSPTVAPASLPDRLFAPYCDILLWPTFDVSEASIATGTKWFTLAFITADGAGNPAWGSSVPVTEKFYSNQLSKLRALGGNAVFSFGGAIGQELALVTTDVAALQRKYQSVIDLYEAKWLDFDIEGAAIVNINANTRRAKAISALKKANPSLKTSITLPAMPTGLTADGVSILKNAVANGWNIDIVNIMAMDYGSGAAPDGANGMGKYAISAAENTYKQAIAAGLINFKIGVTPMIGKNDVAGEVFTLANAKELNDFALKTTWVGQIAYWSINRDTNVNGPLYASSQIVQDKYAFANVFKTFHGSVAAPITAPGPITAPSVPPVPTTTPTKPKYELSLSNKIFAPFCDVLLWPTFDVSKTFTVAETPWYTLAFITADTAGNAAWGSVVPTSQKFYIEELTALRTLGGDAIVSFGGAIGQELALVTLDATELQKKYQGVIDTYQFKWVDFDVEGSAITNAAANTRRAKAIAGLKKANPNLIVSLTLPVMNTGLTGEGIALIQNIVANGAVIDVVNIMAMDYGSGQGKMGQYAIDAAKATYTQVVNAGLKNAKIGITPMIGNNDVAGEVFTLDNANELLIFAKATAWVASLHYWSINRDNSKSGPLYASSQVTQKDYDYAKVFNQFITVSNNPAVTTTKAATQTIRPVPVKPDPNFIGGYRWGKRVFAPYIDTSATPKYNAIELSNSVGSNRYILGPMLSGNNGKPAWGGSILISTLHYLDQIKSIRKFGGDAIISFGGNQGAELATTAATSIALRNHYQNVIDAYGINWIDFNLNDTVLANKATVDKRNQALRDMQLANPNIRISYTIPTTPTGFTANGKYLLESCLNYGVRVDVVNLLAMNYGKTAAPNAGTASASYAIQGATAAYDYIQKVGIQATIGVTPMIGQNDVPSEFFQSADASQLVTWAKKNPWVSLLSFWSVNRDNEIKSSDLSVSSGITQTKNQFSKIFVQFEN